MTESNTDSYSQILRSTSLIGGATGINLLLGIVRMKFAAVLIGPAGVGLVGTYQVLLGMVGSVAGLGIQSSAVRDIAEAVGRKDSEAIGRTILSLRRICWLTGFIGAIAMVALALPLSLYTFNSADYALDIALLGPIILLANIQGGQSALLQGTRRIGDLAQLNVIGSVAGTVVAVALYSWLGSRGIIPSLLLISIIQLIATWSFARKVDVPPMEMSWMESIRVTKGMIRFGMVFMWSGLVVALVAFLTRAWISQDYDLLAVGIFSAAFSLSGMFTNFVLGAMGADYFPRLTEVSHDHAAMRRLVNEQTEIGFLLAVPGLLGTLTLAPWIIRIFYSSEFLPAADLLQWFILGCLGRVISWPLGFVMLALAKSRLFFMTETLFSLLHIGMIWIGLSRIGVVGAAVAFFYLYVSYVAVAYCMARHLIGFHWSPATGRLLVTMLPIVILAFLSGRLLPLVYSTGIGVMGTTIVALLCLRGLVQRLGSDNRLVRMGFRVPGVKWVCQF